MRNLTLNEKITIKGCLASRGITGEKLARLDMHDALYYWSILFGYLPIARHWKVRL